MGIFVAQLFETADKKMEAQELIILILVPLFVAAIVLAAARFLAQRGSSRLIKWIAVVPLAAGILLGVTPYRSAHDELYLRATMASTKSLVLHQAALFVPAAALLLLIAAFLIIDRRHRLEH